MILSNLDRTIDRIARILRTLLEIPQSHREWQKQHRRKVEEATAKLATLQATAATTASAIELPKVIEIPAAIEPIAVVKITEAQDSDLLSCRTQVTQPQLTKQQARRIELFRLLDEAWDKGIRKYEDQLTYIKAHSADGKGTSKRTVAAWKDQRKQNEAQSA
jgi:hypothetical protein